VTADVEGGYGLSAPDLVARLLDAGAVGCNLEDTAHPGTALVAVDRQCDRIAAIRDAARSAGVPIVLNARVDSFELEIGTFAEQGEEALRRARRYREAGADCVYPIMLTDEPTIVRFVEPLEGMVNILAEPEPGQVARFARLGVARISYGPRIHRRAMRAAAEVLGMIAADGADQGPIRQ